MMKKASTYKGIWIPRFILELPELNLRQVVILADIYNLCKSGGQFFKSNVTIAKECRASPATIKRDMKEIERLGYVTRAHLGQQRFIKITNRLSHTDSSDHHVNQGAQSSLEQGSHRPTSSASKRTVMSTLDREQIDGSRFNNFHDNEDLQEAVNGWFCHLQQLDKHLSPDAKNQTWLRLFKLAEASPFKAIRTILYSL